MNMLSFFLARKILLGNVYKKGISTMTFVCFAGIFIGSFSLALVTAIMNGFEATIHEKLQGIHSNITIQAYGDAIDMDALAPVLTKEFPEIAAFSPHATRNLLIRTVSKESTPFVVLANGIDPQKEQYTTTLAQKIIDPNATKNFPQLFSDDQILIGKQLAQDAQINVGDIIELLFNRNDEIQGRKLVFDSYSAKVGGIFDTGIDEFDSGVIYCSFSFLEKLFPDISVDQVNINLVPQTNEASLIKKLRDRLHLEVYSWKDLYPALVATLKLEKYVSFFILTLIVLVASMNIISLLFMHITQKRPDIAILKAMGMTDINISSIFFIMGALVTGIASCCGLIGAYIVSMLLKKYPFIELPDSYYVTHLPIAMNGHILLFVFFVTLSFGLLATWIPVRRIKWINISHVLRFEG